MNLRQERNRRRSRAIHVSERPIAATPPTPIPGDWYDEDYFEHGLKSNWSGGYTWAALSGVFRDTAAYATELFPEAQSFLDAGCAKGFLVRCLREAGKDCWGVDHSAWAIDRADAAARPFLARASVDEMAFDRQVDVLLAFDLLSHLTEAQAERFLTRARPWKRAAIVVIAPFDDVRIRRGIGERQSRSLHVTMRFRTWHDCS